MTNIYDNEKATLPSIRLPNWQKHKLQTWLAIYGMSYTKFVQEIIFELRISFGTGGDGRLANPHRDLAECVGRVVDRMVGRNELQGRILVSTPDHVVKRMNAKGRT